MVWHPIETAPKDGTVIDLWVERRFSRFTDKNGGARVENVWWGKPEFEKSEWPRLRGFMAPEGLGPSDEQWVKRGWRDPVEGAECEFSGGSVIATHWMPLPPAPNHSRQF